MSEEPGSKSRACGPHALPSLSPRPNLICFFPLLNKLLSISPGPEHRPRCMSWGAGLELLYNGQSSEAAPSQRMRMPGVEPGSQAWEACMMPLHYMRVKCKNRLRLLRIRQPWQRLSITGMNPCTSGDGSNESKREVENIPWPIATTKLEQLGFEHSTFGMRSGCGTTTPLVPTSPRRAVKHVFAD